MKMFFILLFISIIPANAAQNYDAVPNRGTYANITLSPTTQAAAYAAGTTIGGLLSFTGVPLPGVGGVIQSAQATFVSGVNPSPDLILFSANPAASTVTDKVALSIATADVPKIIRILHLTDCALTNTSTIMVCGDAGASKMFNNSITGTIYGVLVVRTAVTLGSVADVVVSLGLMQ